METILCEVDDATLDRRGSSVHTEEELEKAREDVQEFLLMLRDSGQGENCQN